MLAVLCCAILEESNSRVTVREMDANATRIDGHCMAFLSILVYRHLYLGYSFESGGGVGCLLNYRPRW